MACQTTQTKYNAHMKKALGKLLTGLFLAGCAGQPSQQELAVADYGPAPGPEFFEAVKFAVKVGLKDPDSLKDLQVGQPKKCGYRSPLELNAKAVYGYCTTIAYNAKNSYGGYVGLRAFNIMYRDGIILEQTEILR